MIIPLKKYLFIGVKEDMHLFFQKAQKEGFIQFIQPPKRRVQPLLEEQKKMVEALKTLCAMPKCKQNRLIDSPDPIALAEGILKNKKQLEKLQEDQRLFNIERARVKPLGDFSLADVRDIEKNGRRHIQFFCIKRSNTKKTVPPDYLIYLNTEYDMDYYMSISSRVESFPKMIEMHVEKSLSFIEESLLKVERKIKQCEHELREDTAYASYLKEHLIAQINQDQLEYAQGSVDTHMDDLLFASEAWIPENRVHSLFPFLENLGIHAEEIAVEEGERVPTYMENQNFGKMGEDLVHIYDVPSSNDKDPSQWVFWSFAIFYAMIISDAGYGLIYLSLALFLKKRFAKGGAKLKRFFLLFKVLSISVIIWGVMAGSYFGIYVQPKNPINRTSLLHILAVKQASYMIQTENGHYQETVELFPNLREVKNPETFLQKGTRVEVGGRVKYALYDDLRDGIFMELSLLVGVIHICLSLVRYAPRHYAGIGWVFAIVGGYLYFPQILGATSLLHFLKWIPKRTAFEVGWQLLIGGTGLALFLALLQNRWKGLVEITKPIEIFADVLSYLRLYALGLAGMILAETFNGMGERLHFALGFFVILLGHTTNIAIGMIGGTIHGLRLNFIEWYHHCFSGGGKRFHPLKLLQVKGD